MQEGDSGVPQNEQQMVVVPENVTGGTFTLTYDGQESDPIAFDASYADVEAALREAHAVLDIHIDATGEEGD